MAKEGVAMTNSGAAGTGLSGLPAPGGLLPPNVRRDLADLNSQYLELGLAQEPDGDPRFAWSDGVRRCLAGTDAPTRLRMAAAPFALFEFTLPHDSSCDPPCTVADGVRSPAPAGWDTRCQVFALQAAFLAWRLVEAAPYAARVALSVSTIDATRLAAMRPSQLATIAQAPGLVCVRWPRHQRFWEMLAGAARADSARALQWAHCVGLCLFGAEAPAAPAAKQAAAARRRPRR
jgi:hypothetical protein